MDTIVIAVDSGKFATKAIKKCKDGTMKKVLFRTKMDETDEKYTADKDSYVIEYDGKRYLVGQTAETVDFEKNKAKLIHKLCTYAAISSLMEDEDKDAKIVLAIGCPLSIFMNVEERNSYQNYFMPLDGSVNLKVNGTDRSFMLRNVVVCPESSGVIYRSPKDYKNQLIGIIDIGGLNTNCCVYDCLNPIKSTSFTTNQGANVLMNEVKQLLNSKFVDANIQDWQMINVLKDGYIKSNKQESRVLISDYLSKHINKVLEECAKKGWDLKNIDLMFVGGGSLMLEKEIKKSIPDAIVSGTAQTDNVEGFMMMGAANAAKR